MKQTSKRWRLNLADWYWKVRHILIFFTPVILLAIEQVRQVGYIDLNILWGLAISLILDLTETTIRDFSKKK